MAALLQLLASASSTAVSWRRFSETNRGIRPAGTLGIPLLCLSTVYNCCATDPITSARQVSQDGGVQVLKLIKTPR